MSVAFGDGAGCPARRTLYLCLHNPDDLFGIHDTQQVLAIVEDPGQ